MANIHFLYRSTRPVAPLYIRFQFLYNAKEFIVEAKTKTIIERATWDWYYLDTSKRSFDTPKAKEQLKVLKKSAAKCSLYPAEKQTLKLELETLKINLNKHIIFEFQKLVPANYTPDFLKKWLQEVVDAYFNPELKKQALHVPSDLISFIDYYLETGNVNEVMKSKYRVLRAKMVKFEKYRRRTILLNEINHIFRREILEYLKEVEHYSNHTIHRDFGYINTLCRQARKEGLTLDLRQEDFKPPIVDKVMYEFLNPEEILVVENLDGLTDSLDNVRDWFLVSIYTGQRISDFMKFNETMIREENGRRLLEFRQKKTRRQMSIPIIPKLQKILDKRGGKFPRKISDPKYNEYLKKLMEKAGFDAPRRIKKRVQVEDGIFEIQELEVPRYNLFSAHSGRRTFCSNAYGKMPTSDIMFISGHSQEKVFLSYIQKSSTDRAHEAAPKLEALYGEVPTELKPEEKLLEELQKLVKENNIDVEKLLQNLKS